MKKTTLNSVVSIVIFITICFSFIALRNDDPVISKNKFYKISPANERSLIINSRKLDTNNISAWFTNNGSFNFDPTTSNAGFEWPRGTGYSARYSSGVWMGCVVGDDTLTAVTEYAFDFKPGYVDDNGNPQGQFDPLYRIYRIERGDTTTSDYQNWPVSQGAYVNSQGRPFFLGTQTMFYVYTDAYPHTTPQGSSASLKAPILQTNWCYTNVGLQDVLFTEFRVINRSNSLWSRAYLSVWTDDDLGDAIDDRIGCDTERDLGFTYNATDNDPIYGAAPPAVGTKVLRSPIVQTGDPNDTVKYYSPPGSQNLITKIGYRSIGMTVFNTYNNVNPQPSDPQNYVETYRVISGLWRTGQPWVDPFTSDTTRKPYSGDPVSGSGWVMTGENDRRFLQSFGPIIMSPGDTQSIIIAQVIARGEDYLQSVAKLRDLSDHVQTIYNQNFQSLLSVKNISTEIPEGFNLYQNYPNPFNPVTKIKFDVTSRLKMQDVKLIIYNTLGIEVATLVNEKLSPGSYEVEFDGSNFTTGVYFYRIKAEGFLQTKKMLLIK
ncbi:MAG: T9SS type A sorting domain-containing protein [Bacteroidota bacterium]|nr:T9SS type A sorting domain-containing protein [Bacteroidota bacterium]